MRVLVVDEGASRRLVVEDRGIGVPLDQVGRIFGVFERLHGDAGYEGVGMGLALAHKAAERLGERVGVEANPGGGSRFWMTLPPLRPRA